MKNISYVYVLVQKEKGLLKIGKANNTLYRYLQFKEYFGELDETLSFQVECAEDFVFKLEKILHLSLLDYNVDLEKFDGYTEYFKIECYEKAKDIIIQLMGFNKNIKSIKKIDTLKLLNERTLQNYNKDIESLKLDKESLTKNIDKSIML